jgi:hypothetical protein
MYGGSVNSSRISNSDKEPTSRKILENEYMRNILVRSNKLIIIITKYLDNENVKLLEHSFNNSN